MTRMSAVTLDLSRFPPPLALRALDVDAVLAERLVRLQALLAEIGIDWDVDQLVANPFGMQQRGDAYRELLTIASVNDAVRAVMVAFAIGADLDHLAAFYGVVRRVISPATSNAQAVLESDVEFRRRVLLAPEAFAAAGPVGAYVFHALTADPRVLNVDVWSPARGEVHIALQSREGDGVASPDLVRTVRSYLHQEKIKPLTDIVVVRSVTNHVFDVQGEAFVLPGPDNATVLRAIRQSIEAMAAARRTPARDMPRSALIAAAHLEVVDKFVLAQPASDIARGFGEVPVLRGLDIKVTTYAG